MKRFFSLVIAVILIMNMAVGALADSTPSDYCVTGIWDEGYLLDDDDNYVDFGEEVSDSVPYGETIYYPLIHECSSGCGHSHHSNPVAVYESRATKSIKIKTDWEDGKSYIDKLSVVKKKYTGVASPSDIDFEDSKYCYFLAITTKQRSTTTTSTNDVSGTIKLKKSSGADEDRFDYDDVQIDVNFEVGYTHPDDTNVIPEIPALFYPDEDFDEDSEETFDFEADDDSYFVVNTNGQKKLVLGMNNDYDDDIADKYPEAELYFFNGNGGHFNRIGYLYLYAGDNYNYVYSIDDKDRLESVKVTHDDDFLVVRTRTLGRYVLSDVKLNVAESVEEEDEKAVIFDNDTQTNHNPGTGGWGFDDIAYNGWGNTQAVATPAVVTAESKAAEPSAPAENADKTDEKSESKPESKPESAANSKEKAKVEKTSAKAAVDAKATTVKVNGNVIEEGLNTRAMLLICCCVGAGSSALGLIMCLFAAISKSRNDYR